MSLSPEVRQAVQRDLWLLAEGDLDGKPIEIRFRPELRRARNISGYSELVVINWKYESDQYGLPTDAALDEVDEFEDHLLTALESDCHTVLAAVITNDGQRQWAMYSSNVDEAGERIVTMPQKTNPYPIEILTQTDTDWVYIREKLLGSAAA